MPKEYQSWIFIFFFIILPLLQWIVRKISEAHAAQAKAREGGAPPALSPHGGRAAVEEEEELPGWVDPAEWESAAEIEAERAPPPRRTLFDEPPVRPAVLSESELAPERGSTAARLPDPRAPAPHSGPRTEPRRVRPLSLPDFFAIPSSEDRAAVAPALSPPLRARPDFLPTDSADSAPARVAREAPAIGGFPGGIADLRKAVMWSEVLGKPRALEPHDGGDRHSLP